MTTMREYVDDFRGEGAWDNMHDLIDKKALFGWDLVPITVDGRLVHIFPGTNREATLEQVQDELRKSLV